MGRRGLLPCIALSLLLPLGGPVARVLSQDMGGSDPASADSLDARGLL